MGSPLEAIVPYVPLHFSDPPLVSTDADVSGVYHNKGITTILKETIGQHNSQSDSKYDVCTLNSNTPVYFP